MTAETELQGALDRYNRIQLAEMQLATGLRYLGEEGPVFLAGPVRIRGLFVDRDGRHWCDAHLVVESAFTTRQERDIHSDRAAGNLDPGHELWQFTPERGRWEACISPVVDVAELLGLSAPEPFPPGWCRNWRSIPTLTDADELELAAMNWSQP